MLGKRPATTDITVGRGATVAPAQSRGASGASGDLSLQVGDKGEEGKEAGRAGFGPSHGLLPPLGQVVGGGGRKLSREGNG